MFGILKKLTSRKKKLTKKQTDYANAFMDGEEAESMRMRDVRYDGDRFAIENQIGKPFFSIGNNGKTQFSVL